MTKQYLVKIPHTKQECLKTLDGVEAMGPKTLSQFRWGCMAGDHTGYGFIEANSEREAKNVVPSFVRGKSKAVPVEKYSSEQIKSFHKM